jgi:enoyl-CoA hydratase/3-hydroxyacyl-CoA dehydrogenase
VAAEAIRLERHAGGVARIVLNRPRLNTINEEVLDGLDRMLTELWADQEVRVVVVTGEGSVFCAGADLSKYFSNSVAFMEFTRKGERTFRRLTEIPKTTIAVLKGYALGGGLELALSCDLRIASEGVELGFPEVGIGLVPAWSGSQRLPRLIGTSLASSMILTSERIKGKRASEIGLAHRLVTSGDPDEAALKWATELASSQAPVAVMLAKRLINKGGEVPSDVGLDMESMAAGVLYGTGDLKEGVSAMLGKRKPEFKGK